jgi:cobalt-zinc-cadmium efflux system outer membrane protein
VVDAIRKYVSSVSGVPHGASRGGRTSSLATSIRANATLTAATLAATLLTGGCAKVKPQPDYARTHRLIEESTGFDENYDPDADGLTADEIAGMLDDGLSLNEATRLALLNNRDIQAAFATIGIARAEWVQSGLLSNPTLGFMISFPESGGRTRLNTDIAQSIVELWQIPIRRRAAGYELETAILTVARQAGNLVAQVRAAYYAAVAARELRVIEQQEVEILQSYVENPLEIGPLDTNLADLNRMVAEVDVNEADRDVATADCELARVLSLDSCDLVTPIDPLPEAYAEDFDEVELVMIARQERLDLRAIRELSESARENIALEYARVFPTVSLGVALERIERRGFPGRTILADTVRDSITAGALTAPGIDSRGQRNRARSFEIDTVLGPNISLELPIFDQNQAQIARASYEYTAAIKSYEELYLNVALDIRIAAIQTEIGWANVAYFRRDVLPGADKTLTTAEEAYRAGECDANTVLTTRQNRIEARRRYILSWLTAAIAQAELERAVGVPLTEYDELIAELYDKLGIPEAAGTQPETTQPITTPPADGD